MRKRIVEQRQTKSDDRLDWLDIQSIATVEVTSEDAEFPIECVFDAQGDRSWRASRPGEQRIRVIFDVPLSVRRIQLSFRETERERTQEFTLRWSATSDDAMTEIVSQQWNFSPAGATEEVEDYSVNLNDVAVLELTINPDISRPEAIATLASWRVA